MAKDSISAGDVRKFLAGVPGLTVPGDMLEAVSGLNVSLDRVRSQPDNPYAHYLLALHIRTFNRNRNIYRALRFMVHPIAVVAFMGLGAALKAADSEYRDPYDTALLSGFVTGMTALRARRDARLFLIVGVICYRYAQRHPDETVWLERAKKAFTRTTALADNALVAADASLGLMQSFQSSDPSISTIFAEKARALGSRSSLLGYEKYSSPSIWDVNPEYRPVADRVVQGVGHVANRQMHRVKNLLTAGSKHFANYEEGN